MVAAEVWAGLSGLKTAFDLAKGLKDIDNAAQRNAAVIELQEKILSAHSEQASLIDLVGELRGRVSELEAWGADKQRYKLTDIGGGLRAYALRDDMENGEPHHYLCAQCFSDDVKSILQPEMRFPGRCDVLACNRCGSDLYRTGS
jgi:hypothetical protein